MPIFELRPGAVFSTFDERGAAGAATGEGTMGTESPGQRTDELEDGTWGADATFDLEGAGCGDLVLALKARFAALRGGQIARVVSTDPGSPMDIPAWCRVTGNELVRARHPQYLIKAKPN
jgi:tRNA 2-thiouridine synthesizing protein A